MAQTQKSDYLDVNYMPGGRRQGVPTDSWGIVMFRKAAQPGLVDTVPVSEGYGAVVEKLDKHAQRLNVTVAPAARTL